MQPRVPKILEGLVIICGCFASGGCLSAVYAIGHHGQNKELVRAQQAKVEVAGTVRDAGGSPLRGVRVTRQRRYLVAGFDAGPAAREAVDHRTVNGRFGFRWDAATSVRLVFEKPGYVPEELEFVVPGSIPIPAYGEGPPAPPITEAGIVVTLRARPGAAAPERLHNRPMQRTGGNGILWSWVGRRPLIGLTLWGWQSKL